MIPRSTSVIVKRSPPKIANRGTAAKYIADAPLLSANDSNPLSNMPKPPLASMSKRFDGKDDSRPQQQLMQSVSATTLKCLLLNLYYSLNLTIKVQNKMPFLRCLLLLNSNGKKLNNTCLCKLNHIVAPITLPLTKLSGQLLYTM